MVHAPRNSPLVLPKKTQQAILRITRQASLNDFHKIYYVNYDSFEEESVIKDEILNLPCFHENTATIFDNNLSDNQLRLILMLCKNLKGNKGDLLDMFNGMNPNLKITLYDLFKIRIGNVDELIQYIQSNIIDKEVVFWISDKSIISNMFATEKPIPGIHVFLSSCKSDSMEVIYNTMDTFSRRAGSIGFNDL